MNDALFSASPLESVYDVPLLQAAHRHADMTEALLALGFRAHDIRLVADYQKTAAIGPSEAIQEVGAGTGEDIARAHALMTDLPYLAREVALPLALDAVRPFAPAIGDDAQPEFCPIAVRAREDAYDVLYAIASPTHVTAVRNFTFARTIEGKKIHAQCCLASRLVVERLYHRGIRDTAREFDEALTLPAEAGRHRLALKALIMHACYQGASDIHFDPLPSAGVLRLRIDGLLTVFRVIKRDAINVDAENSIFDRLITLIAQDIKQRDAQGQAEGALDTEVPPALAGKYQFRVEIMSTVNGPGGCIRILDRTGDTAEFAQLGLDPEAAAQLLQYAQASSGMIVATGPTGSGKTTLINSLMRTIDSVSTSVQTIENPVEVRMGTWRQHETRRLTGHEDESTEWMSWFRGMLRNDPDVVLLGEVRDADVARVAFDMANTGHLVFTTLHAKSASLAVARLREMRSPKTGEGLDMDAAAALLLCIIAIRLVRRLCLHCRVLDDRASTRETVLRGLDATEREMPIYRAGPGCPRCGQVGFRGRIMIYEILPMASDVRAAISERASTRTIARFLPPQKTLWASGLKRVAAGITSLDEVMRVVNEGD